MMPFAGGVENTSNATLLIVVTAAALYAFLLNTRENWLRTIVKTIPVALLAALTGIENGPLLLAVALALSAAGDAFLSRPGERAFVYGLGSFLTAHIAYIALFYLGGAGETVLVADLWRSVIGVAMAVFSLAMLGLLLTRVPPGLRLPITVYVLAILGMGLAALTTSNVWIIAGAVLFMVSDTLLALERFVVAAISPNREWMRFAVWGLYIAAQLAITLGVLL